MQSDRLAPLSFVLRSGMLAIMTDASITRLLETRREAIEKRARLDDDVSAIDRVLTLLGVNANELQANEAEIGEAPENLPAPRESTSSPLREIKQPSFPKRRSQKIRITQEIRKAVQAFEGEFTQNDVVRRIRDEYPFAEVRPQTVSSTLWRMANREGTIEKVREGYGSQPNTYRKISDDGPAQEGFPNEDRTSDEEDTVSKEGLMNE